MSPGQTAVWISGASSGIGAAIARTTPFSEARLIGVGRRPPVVGEHLPADLSDPTSWDAVRASFERLISRGPGELERAVFVHFSGDGEPHGPAAAADPDHYARSVLLNAASGPILGQAFLHACKVADVPAVLVICSSPGALSEHRGMAHYGAAKLALLHWTQVVRAEEPDSVIFAVIPWATDTPMLRSAMAQSAEENPVSAEIRELAAQGLLTAPEDVANAVWEAVLTGAPRSPIHIGTRPPEFQ